jgi:16S rRNA processing protein RimM
LSDRRLCVGRVGRAHGLRGELIVTLLTNRTERLANGAVLHTASRSLVVEQSRPHGERYLVRFVGVTDKDAADVLRGAELFAEPLDDPEELWVHELIGAAVVDQHGIDRGPVVSVEANPASDLLVLASGALVPARFIVDHLPNVRIRVEVPEGLFD